jgi:thiol-disulfide isomerase/thioredoxin
MLHIKQKNDTYSFQTNTMKSLFLLAILFSTYLLNAQSKKREEFILKGTVNYPANRYIYFVWYNADEQRFIDSTKVVQHKFKYKGVCNGYLDRFYVKTDHTNKENNDSLNNVNIPIDNSLMFLKLKVGEFSKYKLTGCKSCDFLAQSNIEFKPDLLLLEKYSALADNSLTDRVKKKKAEDLYLKTQEHLRKITFEWCKKNSSNNLTPIYLDDMSSDLESVVLEEMYNSMDAFQRESFYGSKIKKTIKENVLIDNQIGKPAFPFERKGYDDSMVSLKTLNQNNFVLLDFWASWCKPCRASHPDLIQLFDTYKSTNFKIIGIASDDDNIIAWKNAIKSDSIFIWPHILMGYKKDLMINPDDLGDKYHIHSYPTKLLIDNTGNIIARYAGDDLSELKKKLKEIYKY